MMTDKWDKRFLRLAREISTWSKDPSTRVGAVIADFQNRIVSVGYNGLPAGVNDSPDLLEDREVKYQTILHAELNAILFAGRDLRGCNIYTYPLQPCSRCASMIIQAGLARVISIMPAQAIEDRWGESIQLAGRMFHEVRIPVSLFPEADL